MQTSAFVSSFTPAYSASVSHSFSRLAVTPLSRRPQVPAVRPNNVAAPSMKIFDWKRREAPLPVFDEEHPMTLTTLQPAPGSKKRGQRKGRGEGQGSGRTCGFGNKGQKSRSGRPTRPGFEGGQTPLYRRTPKFVGRPLGAAHNRTEYVVVSTSAFNDERAGADGAEISYQTLFESKVLTKQKRGSLFKIVAGDEEITKKNIVVRAHAFTTKAVEQIEAAGGKCILVSPTTGEDIVIEEENADQAA